MTVCLSSHLSKNLLHHVDALSVLHKVVLPHLSETENDTCYHSLGRRLLQEQKCGDIHLVARPLHVEADRLLLVPDDHTIQILLLAVLTGHMTTGVFRAPHLMVVPEEAVMQGRLATILTVAERMDIGASHALARLILD